MVKEGKVTNRARRALVGISSKNLANLTTIRPTKITTSSCPTMTNPSCTVAMPLQIHNNSNCRIRTGATIKTLRLAFTVARETISRSLNSPNKTTMTTQIIIMSSNRKVESNINIEAVTYAILIISLRMTRITIRMVLTMLLPRCRRCSQRCHRLGIIWESKITAHSILPGQKTTAP